MSLKSTLSQIDELKKELDSLPPISAENLEKLDKKIRLEFHYNTNHLEGNTLTYQETELLLMFDETRGSHTAREYEEMKASDAAYLLVEQIAREKDRPLNENFIRQLNQVLLVRPYWKDAETLDGQLLRRQILIGEYKKQPNSVRLANGEIFHYASPQDTPMLMGDLVSWFLSEAERRELHPVQLAAQLHYRFVRIHPFDDGNGRVSRLLMNYVLLYFNLPPVIIKTDDKKQYLSALRDADTGNVESFENYIAESLIWSLKLYIKATSGDVIDEVDDWRKELRMMKVSLSDSEEIKHVKSEQILDELVLSTVLPIAYSIKEDIATEFAELFLENSSWFSSGSSRGVYEFNTLDGATELYSNNKSVFSNEIGFSIVFEKFKKNWLNPFNMNLYYQFIFREYHYMVHFNGIELYSSLYHKYPNALDIQKIIQVLGRNFVHQIQENIDK